MSNEILLMKNTAGKLMRYIKLTLAKNKPQTWQNAIEQASCHVWGLT